MGAELYLLRPGRYLCELRRADGSGALLSKPVTVAGPSVQVTFGLPPKSLCVLTVQPAGRPIAPLR